MTKYWRNGFWRASVNGNVHWVEGHEVDRNEWDRYSTEQGNDLLLRQARAHVGTTARIVTPNAECPVCSAPVFFYQNQYGSRVFFDELGPPWPKHPCTANLSLDSGEEVQPVAPSSDNLRSQLEFDFIRKWAADDGETVFASQYGTLRWEIAVFVACYSAHDMTVLVIRTADGYRYLIADDAPEALLTEGQLVAYYRNWISYVSCAELRVVELKFRTTSGRRILHHMLGVETLDAAAG